MKCANWMVVGLVGLLGARSEPVPLSAIDLAGTAVPAPDPAPGAVASFLTTLLRHSPRVISTSDGRFFLPQNGLATFLVEILRALPRPAHYRKVTQAFNERVIPRCRRGAGFILEKLNENPACVRVDRGTYDLKTP